MLNALRNPVASEMFSPRGTCRVWSTSVGPGGHLGSLVAVAVWHSVVLGVTRATYRKLEENHQREVGATASFDGLFRENWLFLM